MALSVDIRKALGNFHLAVQFDAGDETLALLGASGCGKSVTLKCIAGILTPDEGHIELDGVTLYDSASRINLPPQRRQVGYLFQQYALFPQHDGAAEHRRSRAGQGPPPNRGGGEAAAVPAGGRGRPEAGASSPAASSSGLRPGPNPSVGAHGHPAGRALLRPGQLPEIQLELELAETLGGFPGTVLWVSHDRGEVFRNCRRVCVIDRGRSQPVTTLGELFRSPRHRGRCPALRLQDYADARPREMRCFFRTGDWTLSC